MNAELQKRIDAAKVRADKAAAQWLKDNEDKIEKQISSMLDRRLEEVVAKLLGFNNSWGRWEVDNCNGRDGNSAAGDWLREKAANAVKEWLTAQAGDLPKLPAAAIKSLRKEYLEHFEQFAMDFLQHEAERNARELVERMVTEAMSNVEGNGPGAALCERSA